MKKKTFKILILSILVLILPSFYYAFNTKIALIDDLFDWSFINLTLQKWLNDAVDISAISIRYRPTWELYNWFTWNLFKESSFLHHLFRIIIKAFIILISFKSYKLILKNNENVLRLSFFSFLAFFIFFPIIPDARLAPQELILVLFFSILSLIVLKVVLNHHGDIFINKKLYISSIIVYFFLLGSKEVSIPIGFGFLVFMIINSIKEKRKLIALLPHLLIFLLCTIKIYNATRVTTYGEAALSFDLIVQNWKAIFDIVFEAKVSVILTIILLFPFFYFIVNIIKLRKPFLELKFLKLENLKIDHYYVINFIGLFLISLTFWITNAYRYYFPLMFQWIFIFGLCVGYTYQKIANINYKRKYIKLIIVSSIYFIMANYYNYVSQYSMQYYIRNNEHKLLMELSKILDSPKNNVILTEYTEYGVDMIGYFTDFSEYFYNDERKNNIKIEEGSNNVDTNFFFVSLNPVSALSNNINIVYTTTENNDDNFLRKAKDISYLVLRKNKDVWIDAGANVSSTWTIYKHKETPPFLTDSIQF